jgi:glycosyltransferase involved in cell wall biosynthesis
VSIALAIYNGEQFLAQQIDSLIAQTYSNIEIIISDDNSTDRSISIVEDYISRGYNIKLVKNSNLKGHNKNFENAILHCNGEYICLSDQDDYWLPEKVEKLLSSIGSNTLIYHNSLFVNENLESLNRTVNAKMNCYSGNNAKVFLMQNCVSGHSIMFNKKLVKEAIPFPEVKFFDWWLAFCATQNGGIIYLDECLVYYRQHSNSVTDMLALKPTTKHNHEFDIFLNEVKWYKCLANAAKTDKPFFEQWSKLYANRENQWLSLKLFLILRNEKQLFFYIRKKSAISNFFQSLKFLWGLKLKKYLSF